jgi:hypothetical protein
MPFDLQIIRANEFVRMDGDGVVNLAASRLALENLAAACRLRGVDRALLDTRKVRSHLKPNEILELVKLFREVGFTHGHKLAFLHTEEQGRRVRTFTFLTAMQGWQVRAFSDFEKAIDWLAMNGPSRRTRAATGSNIHIEHHTPKASEALPIRSK